jgi:hypothetical protein
VIRFGKIPEPERYVKSFSRSNLEGFRKSWIRQFLPHKSCDESEIASLVVIADCERTVRMEKKGCRSNRFAEKVAGEFAYSPGSCRVGTRRAPHDGTDNVVKDADPFHEISS